MTHQGVCGVVVLFNIHETPTRAVVSARWLSSILLTNTGRSFAGYEIRWPERA